MQIGVASLSLKEAMAYTTTNNEDAHMYNHIPFETFQEELYSVSNATEFNILWNRIVQLPFKFLTTFSAIPFQEVEY